MGLIFLSYCVLSESLLFGQFLCILRIKIASEVAYLRNAPKQLRPDRDAYPFLKHLPFLNELT
jgi:hypothetical protein